MKKKYVESFDNGGEEYNDEAGMLKTNLHTMMRACKGLHKLVGPEENLPEWAQEKIAQAKGMIVAVWDYMESQHEEGNIYTNKIDLINKSNEQGVAEGAPELLKKEMPLHRHAVKLLAQNGVSKNDPDYYHHLNNTIKHLRQFGNIDLINKQDVAEGASENAWNAGISDEDFIRQFGKPEFDRLTKKYGSKSIPVPDLHGYRPTKPTDPLVRDHRGSVGPGNQLKSIIVKYNGVNILFQKDDDEIFVKASSGGRELGHVLFVIDGDYLMPQHLEVEERFRGQGIAQTMYDYVKSKGYKIRRSGQQTDAGAGFWDKHKGQGQNVWEQGVAEGSLTTKNVAPVKARPLSMERPKGEWDPIHGKAPKKGTLKYDMWKQRVAQDKKGVAEASYINGKEEDPKSLRWKQTSMTPQQAITKYGKENVRVTRGGLRNGDDMVEVKVALGEQGVAEGNAYEDKLSESLNRALRRLK